METEVLVSCDCGNSWRIEDGRCRHCGSTDRQVYFIVRRIKQLAESGLLEMDRDEER